MKSVFRGCLWVGLIVLTTGMASADWCSDGGGWDSRGHHCEVREMAIDLRNLIEVDAGPNGGIAVEGWNRNEIVLLAKVAANADDDAEAMEIVSQIAIETAGVIRADGPTRGRDRSWWVSFRLQVPRNSNLALEANNGGIDIEGVVGEMKFDTTNGGIALRDVGGDVRGETTNGGVKVELYGDSWEGRGLDVETTNGGVKVLLPTDYNARLETGTTNGGLEIDFPVMVQGRIDRNLEVDLGAGGPTIRVMTTNGGVRIDRS